MFILSNILQFFIAAIFATHAQEERTLYISIETNHADMIKMGTIYKIISVYETTKEYDSIMKYIDKNEKNELNCFFLLYESTRRTIFSFLNLKEKLIKIECNELTKNLQKYIKTVNRIKNKKIWMLFIVCNIIVDELLIFKKDIDTIHHVITKITLLRMQEDLKNLPTYNNASNDIKILTSKGNYEKSRFLIISRNKFSLIDINVEKLVIKATDLKIELMRIVINIDLSSFIAIEILKNKNKKICMKIFVEHLYNFDFPAFFKKLMIFCNILHQSNIDLRVHKILNLNAQRMLSIILLSLKDAKIFNDKILMELNEIFENVSQKCNYIFLKISEKYRSRNEYSFDDLLIKDLEKYIEKLFVQYSINADEKHKNLQISDKSKPHMGLKNDDAEDSALECKKVIGTRILESIVQ